MADRCGHHAARMVVAVLTGLVIAAVPIATSVATGVALPAADEPVLPGPDGTQTDPLTPREQPTIPAAPAEPLSPGGAADAGGSIGTLLGGTALVGVSLLLTMIAFTTLW